MGYKGDSRVTIYPEEIIKKLSDAVHNSVETTMRSVNVRYKSFCELSGKEYVPIKNEWSVIAYENLYDEAVKNCPDIKMILEEKTEELLSEKTDKREIPIYLIRSEEHTSELQSR